MIPGSANPLLLGGGGYRVQRSVRLRASASAYLDRMFSAGDQKTWTLSLWLKRGALGQQNILQTGGVGGSVLYFGASDELRLSLYISSAETRVTNQVFRDPSAWYHLVLAVDTTQAIASDRVKMSLNGDQITSFSTANDPGLNTTFAFNSAASHTLGLSTAQLSGYLDAYAAEFYFVDGKQFTPSTFAEIDAVTGKWVPKSAARVRTAVAVGGGLRNGFGVNGFYEPFSDITSLTTLGYDRSQSDTDTTGNNWTTNNISLTAGVTYDSMLDVPGLPWADGGNGRGNYCTLSPLNNSAGAVSDGNLTIAGSSNHRGVAGTFGMQAGVKWQYEFLPTSYTNGPGVGVIDPSYTLSTSGNPSALGAASAAYFYRTDGNLYDGAGGAIAYGAAYTSTDVITVAYDGTTGQLVFYKNGVSQGVAVTLSTSVNWLPLIKNWDGSQNINFGQRPLSYPVAGFKALQTGNLTSDTVITSGSFTGNTNADGPDIWMNGAPETLTINGNAVTWGTHADRLANGFKLRTASASYNAAGSNTWSATILSPASKSSFRHQNAKANP